MSHFAPSSDYLANEATNPPGCSGRRILVVDDDEFSRKHLRSLLEHIGYSVTVAKSGMEAMGLLTTTEKLDCVLTDYRMADGDGLELLGWVKAYDPYLSTIVITGAVEQRVVESSLRGGATGFLHKPVFLNDLIREAEKACDQTCRQRRFARIAADATQMGYAQRFVLGSNLHDGQLATETYFHPWSEAGGDFLCSEVLGPGRHAFLMADVSGHDLKAAYVAAYSQGLFRGMLQSGSPLLDVLRRFNDMLTEWSRDEAAGLPMSLAVAAFLIDSEDGAVQVSVNGAPKPIAIDVEGIIAEIGDAGFPLGWMNSEWIDLQPVSQAVGTHFRFWSDGLEDLADRLRVSPLSLLAALRRFRAAGVRPNWLELATDDLVAACISSRGGAPSGEWEPLLLAHYSPDESAHIDAWQCDWARSIRFAIPGITEDCLTEVLLCAREGLLNALHHGCRAEETATLQAAWNSATHQIQVRVDDPGEGHSFDVEAHKQRACEEMLACHRGLILMTSLPEQFLSSRRGASVTMRCALRTQTC